MTVDPTDPRASTAAEAVADLPARPAVRGIRYWIRQLVPAVIAAVAIGLILHKYPPSDIAQQMRLGEPLAIIPYAVALVIVNLLLVSVADALVIRGCLAKPAFWEILRAKAGVTVLNLVGYAAAHGGYGVWIARKTGASVKLTSGIMVYIIMSELFAVCFVATLSMTRATASVAPAFRLTVLAIAVILLLLVLIGSSNVFRAQSEPGMLAPWRLMSRKRAALHLAVRTVQIGWITTCTWGAANAFGMSIPFLVMATFFPVVLVVGSLPVNVGGFGAVQGAWLLLSPWAPGEQVLAFSFLWLLVSGVAVFLRGFLFVRTVVAEIDEGALPKVSVGAASPT